MGPLPSEPRLFGLQLDETEFCETGGDVDAFEDVFDEMDNWEDLFGNFLDDEVVAGFWPQTPESLPVHQLTEPESFAIEPSVQSPSRVSLEISDSSLSANATVALETFCSRDDSASQLGNLNRSLSLPNTSHIANPRAANPWPTSLSLKSGRNNTISPLPTGGRLSLPTISVPKLLPNAETPHERGGSIQILNKPEKNNAGVSHHQRRRRSTGKTDVDPPEFKKR